MKAHLSTALAAGIFLSANAHATYNATSTGTVKSIQQSSPSVGATPGTFYFQISTQPTVNCGAASGYFIVSPNSVSDAQTRINFLAILMSAQATGSQVEVAYDSTGGFCDQGAVGVYYIVIISQ